MSDDNEDIYQGPAYIPINSNREERERLMEIRVNDRNRMRNQKFMQIFKLHLIELPLTLILYYLCP